VLVSIAYKLRANFAVSRPYLAYTGSSYVVVLSLFEAASKIILLYASNSCISLLLTLQLMCPV
jgi:hypothetical protein